MNAEYNMIEFDRELLEIPLHYTRDIAWKTTQALKSTTETADVLAKQIADQELSKLATISRTIGLSPQRCSVASNIAASTLTHYVTRHVVAKHFSYWPAVNTAQPRLPIWSATAIPRTSRVPSSAGPGARRRAIAPSC